MMMPGAIALITPVIVGFIFGPEVLGGLLAGVTVSGVLMGIFQSNAGGAWDNAKKSFEKGVLINGEMFYKKSEPHKASVTGDTVGDPFKDTSGPSMNILIKLMSIVSLVIAPFIAGKTFGEPTLKQNKCTEMSSDNCQKMGKCDMSKCATMTKDQCAAMCDSMGCDSTEKAVCMSHYGEDGKFMAGKCERDCCNGKTTKKEGCSGEAACDENNDKPCSKGDECCKNKKK
jgi:K(+)-stimulated pyrophosphate-energized sodium pump